MMTIINNDNDDDVREGNIVWKYVGTSDSMSLKQHQEKKEN